MGFFFDVLIPTIRIWASIISLFLRNGYGLLIYPLGFRRHLETIGLGELMEKFPQPSELLVRARYVSYYTETVTLETPDGERLRAYLSISQRRPTKATIIMFHGNAAIVEFNGILHEYILESSCNIMSVSYRGYGHSSGTPSEAGLRIDAQAALDYVLKRSDLSHNIVLYGHSIGGAVVIDLASRNPNKVSGLVIQSTFNSIPKLMGRFILLSPFLWTIRQRWESDLKLWTIPRSIPILMLCGLKDQVIPPIEMRILMDIARLREGGGQPLSYMESWRVYWTIRAIRHARWAAFWKVGSGAVLDEGDCIKEVAANLGGEMLGNTTVITRFLPDADHNNMFEQEDYYKRIQSFLENKILDGKEELNDKSGKYD